MDSQGFLQSQTSDVERLCTTDVLFPATQSGSKAIEEKVRDNKAFVHGRWASLYFFYHEALEGCEWYNYM